MKPASDRIAVSGMGCETTNGSGVESLWRAVIQNDSGIDSNTGLGKISDEVISDLKSRNGLPASSSRALALAVASAKEAMAQAHWKTLNEDDGLIIATTTGQIDLWEDNFSLSHQPLGSLAVSLGEHLGFSGKTMTLTTACTAATQALALGRLWLRQNKVKRCLIGGVEILAKLTVEGFRSLQLLNSSLATPFDAGRKGINLSEGAAFLCLENNPARALAVISGAGSSSDAYHLTSPHPEGRGSFESMQAALKDAGLEPADIFWVHAHGTGSKANDEAEGKAINSLFPHAPWASSTKNIHGHMLGGSGALETVLCIRALQKNTVLKTAGLANPDVQLNHPVQHIEMAPAGSVRHVMKNTLGFGGNNASLVLSHFPERQERES